MVFEEACSMFSVVQSEFEHDSVAQARDAAMEAAASTGGRVFPCQVFRQGIRLMIATSFPFTFVAKQVAFDSATKGGNPRTATNRPLMIDHVKVIRDYILNNPEVYIIPPVTLNIRHVPQVHVAKANVAVRSGFLVIDDSTVFYVTDGQHRIGAIAGIGNAKPPLPGVLTINPDMANHALSVMLVVEPEIERIHQDFADAAQTKQIPPSLLAAYNMREPINRVLSRVVDSSRLLSGRVDETSKTLSKMSQNLFLLNQVRGLVKELLVADYAMEEKAFSRNASHRLATVAQQDEFIRQTGQLLEVLSTHMRPWNEIVEMPAVGGVANRIPDLRADYINLTATGLVIIGRVAYEINKLPSELDRLQLYADLAKKVDWRRMAAIWQGTIVTQGKLSTNRGPVGLAANAVKDLLGLSQRSEDTEVASSVTG